MTSRRYRHRPLPALLLAAVFTLALAGGSYADTAEPSGMSAAEVQRAFERALLMTGMEGWLERPPHGGARMVQVIYDHQRRVFKAPLEPPMSYGDQIRLTDGRVFSVQAVRNFEAEQVPCYQEIAANQVA